MKTQMRILIFIACLNLSVGIVVGLALPGTEFMQPAQPSMNATEYESHFNATDVAEGWGSTPFSGIPVIGDIFSGLNFLWSNFQYLIDGFPIFLQWISDTYILDVETQNALNYILWALRGIYAVMMGLFVIEFISGRVMTD
jgi:hypothetical protein